MPGHLKNQVRFCAAQFVLEHPNNVFGGAPRRVLDFSRHVFREFVEVPDVSFQVKLDQVSRIADQLRATEHVNVFVIIGIEILCDSVKVLVVVLDTIEA